jgi:hypothetical protein
MLQIGDKQCIINFVRTKQRVRDIGEVFTGKREVEAMLDLVGDDIFLPNKTILEPSCGNGNFLIEILLRRLDYIAKRNYKKKADYERNVLITLSNLYGIDIMEDNIDDCKKRMYNEIVSQYSLNRNTESPDDIFIKNVKEILLTNIILGDSLNEKRDINFIKYNFTSKGEVKRSQYNLLQLENGSIESEKVFDDADIKNVPSINPEKLMYYKGEQTGIFASYGELL